MKVELTDAYVLHSRPFKDSSAILDCFSKEHGIVALIAKGAKRPRSKLQGLIHPFKLLQVGWQGNNELKTLTRIEAEVIHPKLTGQKILLGLYLNELLIKLLQRHDPYPQLFVEYGKTLEALSLLQDASEQQLCLRQFELTLLVALGYGLNLSCDAKTGAMISPELLYSYDANVGIFEAANGMSISTQFVVSGASILALLAGRCDNENQLREAKKLMRYVLAHYLGNKPIQSRQLFVYAKV
ncbi:MAG: DNA repair protein RecO [Proteobacteria bacterium]|nr:DNA repair protein RecO [Pseudomonadota bacterium]